MELHPDRRRRHLAGHPGGHPPQRLIDQVARIISIVGYSFPTFVFGLLMLMIFYAGLEWFPPGRLSDWASQVVYSTSSTSTPA